MANIETTANASMVKPTTFAISVSRFCLRSLRFNAEFIMFTVVCLYGSIIGRYQIESTPGLFVIVIVSID